MKKGSKMTAEQCARVKAGLVGHRPKQTYSKERIRMFLEAGKATRFNKGYSNPLWKGQEGGYVSHHDWIKNQLGQPDLCFQCGECVPPDLRSDGKPMTELGKRDYFQWANISDKYRRDINDWLRLCHKCHKQFDSKKIKLCPA